MRCLVVYRSSYRDINSFKCVPLLNCSGELNIKLERSLNSAIRFVFRIPRFFHISFYRNQLSWLNIKYRRQYFLSIALHSIFRTGYPTFLAMRFTPLENIEGLILEKSSRLVFFHYFWMLLLEQFKLKHSFHR